MGNVTAHHPRLARIPDLVRLQHIEFDPVGGPLTRLDIELAPNLASMILAGSSGIGRHRIFLSVDDAKSMTAVHVVRHTPAKRWVVVRTGETDGGSDQLADLLDAVAFAAGDCGIERIVASVLDDDDRLPVFELSGFRPLTRETVMVASLTDVAGSVDAPVNIRPFQQKDLGKAQRLFTNVTPQHLGLVDLMTAEEFARQFVSRKCTAVVAESGGDLCAAVGLRRAASSPEAVATLLAQIGAEMPALAVLNHSMEMSRAAGVQLVWLPVRDYQSELVTFARRLGFEVVGRRTVLARNTVAMVRHPVFAFRREAAAPAPVVPGSRIVHVDPTQGPHQSRAASRIRRRPH